MKTLFGFFNRPISDENHDGTFARWACAGSAVGVFILATVFFCRHAQDLVQLLAGLTLTVMTVIVLFWTGITTSQLQKAVLSRKIPMRARLPEFAGYVATLGILFAGVLYLPSLPLDRVGMTMGLLVILLASLVPSGLGAWSTLRAGRAAS